MSSQKKQKNDGLAGSVFSFFFSRLSFWLHFSADPGQIVISVLLVFCYSEAKIIELNSSITRSTAAGLINRIVLI